jgi:hypothetical protein
MLTIDEIEPDDKPYIQRLKEIAYFETNPRAPYRQPLLPRPNRQLISPTTEALQQQNQIHIFLAF